MKKNQFGFRENLSTEDALEHFMENIYNNVDKAKPTAAIFIDLAKAFDTLHHEHLLKKLEYMGMRGKSQELLKNYLENRWQSVRINKEESNVNIMQYGIPQGTVIGPLLFILYINDLYNISKKYKIFSFADDTSIVFEDKKWDQLLKNIKQQMPEIQEWFCNNLLTINVDKTYFLLFGQHIDTIPTISEIQYKYRHEIIKIKISTNVKYLGVIIDCHLRWDHHIKHISNKLRYLPYTFSKFRNIFDSHCIIHYFDLN